MMPRGPRLPAETTALPTKQAAQSQTFANNAQDQPEFSIFVDTAAGVGASRVAGLPAALAPSVAVRSLASDLGAFGGLTGAAGSPMDSIDCETAAQPSNAEHDQNLKAQARAVAPHDAQKNSTVAENLPDLVQFLPMALTPAALPQAQADPPTDTSRTLTSLTQPDKRTPTVERTQSTAVNAPALEQFQNKRAPVPNSFAARVTPEAAEPNAAVTIDRAAGAGYKAIACGSLASLRPSTHAPAVAGELPQSGPPETSRVSQPLDESAGRGQSDDRHDDGRSHNHDVARQSANPEAELTSRTIVISGSNLPSLPARPLFHQVARALVEHAASSPAAGTTIRSIDRATVETRELMIELNPRGLGRIVAALAKVGGQLRVRLHPESDSVAQQLKSDIGNLTRVLAAAGVPVSDISVAPTSKLGSPVGGSIALDPGPGAGAWGQEPKKQRADDGREKQAPGRAGPAPAAAPAISVPSTGTYYLV